MPTELDKLLAETDATIANLRDDLRLEERLRERLLTIRQRFALAVPTGGHRPAGMVVNGSLISRIISILGEAKRPMRAKEIAAKVKAQGFTTTAKTGLNIAISSQLAHGFKDGKFDRPKPGLYAMKTSQDDHSE